MNALAVGPGHALYLGGSFASLATRTGHWVRFDASGVRDMAWPDVDNTVNAVVPDGRGGWFIGGAFTHVAGQRRAGLAHVGPGGELDPSWSPDVGLTWDPGLGGVMALCVVGDTVYVAGEFERINGRSRDDLAAVDAFTGRLRAWHPRPDGYDVTALAAASGKLYVGGDFTFMGSARRKHLAAFDAASGKLEAWNPGVTGFDFPDWDVSVYRLLIDRDALYVGGQFDRVAGQARPGIAAFDVATGELSAWNPREINRSINAVDAIAVSGDTVYVSVDFGFEGEGCRQLDGSDPAFVVAIDATTRAAVRWCARLRQEPSLGQGPALAVVGDRLYVGGGIEFDAGMLRAVVAATGALGGWDQRPNGQVSSLVATGDGLLAGGFFSGLARRSRHGVAAIGLDTGALLPFDPHPTDGFGFADGVSVMARQGKSVFAAGDFVAIGGRRRRSLAKLDPATGRARRWNARVGSRGTADALAVRGRRLYVGGSFRRVGGRLRRGLAALDTRTGRATGWRADANGRVRALAIRGHTLFIAGDFTRVAGYRRRHAAAIDLRNGRVTAFHPDPDGPVRALAFGGRSVYLGGKFRRVGGRRRTNLAAVNVSSGKLRRWRADANATVYALAVIDRTLYAGGAFSSIARAPRTHIAALDARTGAPTAWNPGANGSISALLATPAGLVAAGSFSSLGGTSQTGFGIFAPTAKSARL